jgi:gamma-glutamylcyclotransferase (GGCT)/AIG2-like uncharacterized protein YtfP
MDGPLVFVYGTLRQGDCRFGIPTLVGVLCEEAELHGFDMLSIQGQFPGLVPGDGTVKGEVHVFKNFSELDRIEGYDEEAPEDALYRREKVIVSTPGGDVEASTYVFNEDPDVARSSYQRVETGDWFDLYPPCPRAARSAD